MPQSHTQQLLSMCHQNSIRGRPENSLQQKRTHASVLNAKLAGIGLNVLYVEKGETHSELQVS